jgi:hypothetical protein
MLGFYPFYKRLFIQMILPTLMSDQTLSCIGWQKPSRRQRFIAHSLLKLRSFLQKINPVIVSFSEVTQPGPLVGEVHPHVQLS